MRHHAAQDTTKPGAPIAQVLNDTDPTQETINSSSASHVPPAAPFSGKLADLLLDTPDRLRTSEWRRSEHQYEEPSRTAGENPVFKLPQLPQLPTKTTERARIPPLLQGLHQPPPLPPSGRLFPPITDGASGFEQDIRDRINSVNASQEARSKASKDRVSARTGESNESNDVDGEHDKVDDDDLPSSKPVPSQDQEQPSSSAVDATESQAAPQKQKGKKRKRWSDDETRDLLLGVSRFGIGKWKRILQCPDYTFQGRTAVDLKDRFRVCCPPEGSKTRKPKRQGEEEGITTSPKAATRSSGGTDKPGVESPSKEALVQTHVAAQVAEVEPQVKHPKLIELGIQTPFAKSTRRPRRGFTSRDDENLRKGFEKYGAAWHSMRDDRELGFGTRQPTDLRDRFRIRYPEAYAQAGYKTKAKVKARQRDEPKSSVQSDASAPPQEPDQSLSEPKKRRPVEDGPLEVTVSEVTERCLVPTSIVRQQLPYAFFPTDPGSFSFGDVSSGMPPDKDGNFTPIVLNRNILQWADANNFLMANTNATATGSYATNHALDMSMHITYPNDGIHIDPMATLKLPLMAIGGGNNISSSALNPNFTNNPSSSIPRLSHTTATMDTLSAPNPWQASSRTSDDLLRTPNLPTIVFPHVPTASARGAVHNLPTPADLLSRMGHSGDADAEGDFGWGPS